MLVTAGEDLMLVVIVNDKQRTSRSSAVDCEHMALFYLLAIFTLV